MQVLRGEPGVVSAMRSQVTDDETHVVRGSDMDVRSPEPEALGKLRDECLGPSRDIRRNGR